MRSGKGKKERGKGKEEGDLPFLCMFLLPRDRPSRVDREKEGLVASFFFSFFSLFFSFLFFFFFPFSLVELVID